MKKQFFAAAMILALGAGFTACSSDDLNVKDQKEVKSGKTATGYLTYTFSVAAPTTRATATNDGQEDQAGNPNSNFVEKWKGNDQIEKVTAYIFDGDQGGAQLEAKVETPVGDLTFAQEEGGKTVIKPKKAIKVTVGKKTVYLVVNPTSDVSTLLDGINNLGEFKAAYESSNLAFAARTASDATSATANTTAAEGLYKAGTTAGAPATIVMTGAPVTQDVAQGVSKTTTVNEVVGSTANNRFSFTMKRAVATVFVTSEKAAGSEFDVLKGDDPLTPARETDAVLATVSDLKFSQGQGELKLYFQQKAGAAGSNTAYETPAYNFVLAGNGSNYDQAATKYDYNGLWKSTAVTSRTAGVLAAGDGENVVKSAAVVPFLPATHQWTAEGTNYSKGNTAYVLVRATLKPKYLYKLEGDNLVAKAYTDADKAKFFYGSDNKFYATKEAVTKAKESNASLTAKEFVDGKGLYTVWINPDTPTGEGWKNGPTNRNNIYHISIKGIKSMPENWNPLVPGGVNNPDPKPTDNPNEPESKHKPQDPLSNPETWMSVDAQIVPWSIHSYGVEL